jgi:hypothetical protein
MAEDLGIFDLAGTRMGHVVALDTRVSDSTIGTWPWWYRSACESAEPGIAG